MTLKLPKRKTGPRGPRLDYAKILKLLAKSPTLSYAEIAERAGCSVSSVSKFATLPSAKRNALAGVN